MENSYFRILPDIPEQALELAELAETSAQDRLLIK